MPNSGPHAGARNDRRRREVAEHRRRTEHVHAHRHALRIQIAITRRGAVGRSRAECAEDVGDELRRMTQAAVVGVGLDVAARFGIEQNPPHDGPEVAARTASATEYGRHTRRTRLGLLVTRC